MITLLLEIIIGLSLITYFTIFFIWFLTIENPLYMFFNWIEKEIEKLIIKEDDIMDNNETETNQSDTNSQCCDYIIINGRCSNPKCLEMCE